nr:SDR family NAD(P)-dependent oxidoreductase [Thermoflexibacter sp.]
METKNKIALVTGGSRGLGKNMALALAKKQIGVILTYREKQVEAQEVVNEITKLGGKAVALPLDIGNLSSFDDFLQAVSNALKSIWGVERFDFLVN